MKEQFIRHLKNFRGFYITISGIILNVLESLYFGYGTKLGFNLKPMSVSELICDAICMIILILGVFFILRDNRSYDVNVIANEETNRVIQEVVKERKISIK